MAMRVSRVTRKGQVTIPVDIRRDMGLNEGDLLGFEKHGNQFVLVRPEDLVRRTSGSLAKYAHNMPSIEPHEMRELAAQAIAEDFKRKMEEYD
jgi:AbrB family looped-hinge helix DNA binding protein